VRHRSTPTARQPLGSGQQDRAAAAAHVEQRLVAFEPEFAQQPRPDHEFSDARRVDVGRGAEPEEQATEQRSEHTPERGADRCVDDRDHHQDQSDREHDDCD
jgi:hypothetical protein